jgi:hypothetical protein
MDIAAVDETGLQIVPPQPVVACNAYQAQIIEPQACGDRTRAVQKLNTQATAGGISRNREPRQERGSNWGAPLLDQPASDARRLLGLKQEAPHERSVTVGNEQVAACDRLANLFTELAGFPLLDATVLKPRGSGIEERLDG